MEQKKALDDNLEKEINKIELKYRTQMQPLIDKVPTTTFRSTPLLKETFNSLTQISRE